MAELSELNAFERGQIVLYMRAIVDCAKHGERMHLPGVRRIWSPGGTDKAYIEDVEQLATQFAQLALHYLERLQFVCLMSMTSTQTAVQRMEGAQNFYLTAMREILSAARDGTFPEWWPEQRSDAPVTR